MGDLDKNITLFFITVFVAFVFIIYFNELIISYKNNKNNNNRKILCYPSGEIKKINDKKWNKLIKKNLIHWSNKYRHYLINDKYFNN
jgi:hypothetical protein